MTSVLVHSANFGSFDAPPEPVRQKHAKADSFQWTDANTPMRTQAMTPRLQARIPKCFGWDIKPGYDVYLWHDASLSLQHSDSVTWCLDTLGTADIAVFAHPVRHTIRDEAEFLRMKLHARNAYLSTRYGGEDLDGQLAAIAADPTYVDDRLFASGAFWYRPRQVVRHALKEWWYHISRFHCIDQLAFPFVLNECRVVAVQEDIYHASAFRWTRARHHG